MPTGTGTVIKGPQIRDMRLVMGTRESTLNPGDTLPNCRQIREYDDINYGLAGL